MQTANAKPEAEFEPSYRIDFQQNLSVTLSFLMALQASDAVDGALKRMGANKPIISRAGVLIVARRVNMEKLWWN
jgi:hypothetical protein